MEKFRKRSPDPSEGSQAKCQDITANQGPTTVSTVSYGTVTKYQHTAASKCEWHAQLVTDTAVSLKWLKYHSLFGVPAAKRILSVEHLVPSVHLVGIDITHVIFYPRPSSSFSLYCKRSKTGSGNSLEMRLYTHSLPNCRCR